MLVVLLGIAVLSAPATLFYASIARARRALGGAPLPGPAPRLRDGGNLRPLLGAGLLDYYRGLAGRFEADLVVWAGVTPHIVIVEPDSVVRVLSDREDFVRHVVPTRFLFGTGLLRLEGEEWRSRRSALMAGFRRDALDAAVGIVQSEADALVDSWAGRGSAPFAPSRDLSFRMLRILGRFLFDFEFDADRHGGKPLHLALITLSTGTVIRHLLPNAVLRLRGDRSERDAQAWMDTLGREILRDGGPTPFLQALRERILDGALDERAALDEIRTFLVAGHETSATAIAWTLALLAEHPDIQRRVAAEACHSPPLRDLDDLASLPYTTQVLQESMRLYPPVPISISITARETQLGGRTLPAGTRVDVASYVIQRDSRWWPDPDRFDPDRFAPGVAPAPGTWFPFLLGPHTCMGIRFAMLELPIVLATLIRAFEVTAASPARVNLRLSLHPAGFKVALRPRTAPPAPSDRA